MKVMKKFTAIALSLAMMLVTSISVFAAAGTYTITAPAMVINTKFIKFLLVI